MQAEMDVHTDLKTTAVMTSSVAISAMRALIKDSLSLSD